MKKEELMEKWCKEYDLLVSDINYQKDKIKGVRFNNYIYVFKI